MKMFRGTYTVMITPFAPSGDVDVAALRAFVDWQVAEGIHGLIPLGSTGEFLSLDDDEKALVAEVVITQELVHHYKTVADAISLPIMVYNNPATANVDLKPPLVARIAEIDNCLYIKESTLEVTRVRDIIRLCGDRMTVFGGILGRRGCRCRPRRTRPHSRWSGASVWLGRPRHHPGRRHERVTAALPQSAPRSPRVRA